MVIRSVIISAVLGLAFAGLSAVPANAATKGLITGTVTDAAGHVVDGAVVEYHALSGEYQQATTDSGGVYRLRVHAPSHAYLDVYDQSDYPLWSSGDITFDPKSTVILNVALTGSGVSTLLYGRVIDAKTRKPISRLHISSLIHEGDNDSDAYTNRDGWYAFTEYDGDGEGYAPLSGEFTYDLRTDATPKYAPVEYNEEVPTAAGPGIIVSEGHRVRFDISVPRRGGSTS